MPGFFGVRCARLALATCVAAASVATTSFALAQGTPRSLAQLGQSDRAELDLLAEGAPAFARVAALLDRIDVTDAANQARVVAALRVLGQLAPVAERVACFDAAAVLRRLFDRCAPQLRLAVVTARADLAPYASDRSWSKTLYEVRVAAEPRAWFVQHMRQRGRLRMAAERDVDGWIDVVRNNVLFEREVAAEQIGVRADAKSAAVDELHRALRDPRKPQGWDALHHNGIVVVADDEFRLRAASALVRIAPDDRRNSVAFGVIAARHPLRSVRLDALRRLATLGPLSVDALAELVEAAGSRDAETAAKALEAIGMVGPTAVRALPVVERLAGRSRDAIVVARARALTAQLRAIAGRDAAGAVEAARELGEAATASRVAGWIDDLDGARRPAATASLRGLGESGIDALVQRVRERGERTSLATLEVLAELASEVTSAPRRRRLAEIILLHACDHWWADRMASVARSTRIERATLRIVAPLLIDMEALRGDWCAALRDPNPYVRREALRQLEERPQDVTEADAGEVAATLGRSLVLIHKGGFPVDLTPTATTAIEVDLTVEIRAAARRALERLVAGGRPAVAAAARRVLADGR